ncbi:MAG: MGMT family protein, partial [Planctomycetales bacterium]|nr:MGMT family protein [Planctomycetales bacterium]
MPKMLAPAMHLPELPDMPRLLHGLLMQLPAGRVTTYGDLAKALGDVAASRWAASFLLHDRRAEDWPTHRVVRADGSLGGHMDGTAAKERRLRAEGVAVIDGRVDLAQHALRDFQCDRPLETL